MHDPRDAILKKLRTRNLSQEDRAELHRQYDACDLVGHSAPQDNRQETLQRELATIATQLQGELGEKQPRQLMERYDKIDDMLNTPKGKAFP